MALYTEYRPQKFSEVVGQEHTTDTLSNAIENGRIVHAYLFCGPKGTGKTTTARILAKAINCEHGPSAEPCNECEACLSITKGNAIDVIEIDAASNRKIDEIRDLLEKVVYAPAVLRKKVYIIDEVHQLTNEAVSALLKTLEEPPGHVIFILATTETHKLLPTIVSRCQRFDFRLVPDDDVAELLTRIAREEGIGIEPEAIRLIAQQAHGAVRDAVGNLDRSANLSELVTAENMAELLGQVEPELALDMVDCLIDENLPGVFIQVQEIMDSGKDIPLFTESLIGHLRYLFLLRNAANPEDIVLVTPSHMDSLVAQSKRMKPSHLMRLIAILSETRVQMKYEENPRIALECALIKANRPEPTVENLEQRLSALEQKLK